MKGGCLGRSTWHLVSTRSRCSRPATLPWQQTIEVKPDLGDMEIKLEPGHPLRIKFSDQAGKPIPNVTVGIGEWRGTEAIFNNQHPNVPDSGIPRQASANGIYEWDWAPADGVNYQIFGVGIASQQVTADCQANAP